ncbi:hypothetical protein ACNTMW_29140 [Planosporangium sp. 12N6]|uniref:hypothetical protein n=1 Tax=Planosporangium spinosum TaxID=3402278 RepID=UPI003CF4920A
MTTDRISREELVGHLELGLLRTVQRTADDPLLRELAGEVLAGNTTLTEAMRSSAYGEPLAVLLDRVAEDPDALGDGTLDRYREQVRAFEERLSAEQGITIEPGIAIGG